MFDNEGRPKTHTTFLVIEITCYLDIILTLSCPHLNYATIFTAHHTSQSFLHHTWPDMALVTASANQNNIWTVWLDVG